MCTCLYADFRRMKLVQNVAFHGLLQNLSILKLSKAIRLKETILSVYTFRLMKIVILLLV